jgi:ATP-GRASP peptide maturase of grasp-with-spasm system
MVVIFSKNTEPSTDDVIDWLSYFEVKFKRLNIEDVFFNKDAFLLLTDEFEDFSFETMKGVNSIWLRRWYDISLELNKISFVNYDFNKALSRLLHNESAIFSNYLFNQFKKLKWLTKPHQLNVNKLIVLQKARECGLKIPKTLVTSNFKKIQGFNNHCVQEIITKPISEAEGLHYENEYYKTLTAKVNLDKFYSTDFEFSTVSLFQEKIDKEYEIRTFYMNKKLFSMAIFSQNDKKTEIDFRNYNSNKPNRRVPVNLPLSIEKSIIELMKKLDLDTGSIDLIKTKAGDFIFLEVNPVGQFNMVSSPCNYYIEKHIAEFLIQK